MKIETAPEPQQLGIMPYTIIDASQNPYFCSIWGIFQIEPQSRSHSTSQGDDNMGQDISPTKHREVVSQGIPCKD